MKERHISDTMMTALQEGELSPLLQAVRMDDTLDMELRGSAVNIYYRGGSIFKITQRRSGFVLSFDTEYCTAGPTSLPPHPTPAEAVADLPLYKQAMDWWFHQHPKYEREFRQLIARENNSHGKISNGTDYYIADIEFVEGRSRFDMVALKWPSTGAARKDTSKLSLALIEVKYGDGALKGTSGIEKHLADHQAFLDDPEKVAAFCRDMAQVFAQKCALGLVEGLSQKRETYEFHVSPLGPEVILLFANHDPESRILPTVLAELDPDRYSFPILVAEASCMGYGLYTERLRRLQRTEELT